MRDGVEAGDGVDAHDIATMHAHEAIGVESSGDRGQALAHHVLSRSGVDNHVFAGGRDAVDLLEGEREPAVLRLDDEAFTDPLTCDVACQFGEGRPSVGTCREQCTSLFQRAAEARAVIGLEQVIDRVRVEGAERVGIVRGRENDGKVSFGAGRLEYLEAVDARDLHVENQQVGTQQLELAQRLQTVRCLAHDLEALLRCE